MFNTAYYGMLRIGEVAKSQHVIKARDVRIATNKDKLMLILRSSKTHWVCNKPQVIKLGRENTKQDPNINSNSSICPYRAIRHYIHQRPTCQTHNSSFLFTETEHQ